MQDPFSAEEKKYFHRLYASFQVLYVNTNNNIFSSCHLKSCDIITRRAAILYFKMGLHFFLIKKSCGIWYTDLGREVVFLQLEFQPVHRSLSIHPVPV